MLARIHETAQRYAQVLSGILKVDVGIADENLRYIAGTGPIREKLFRDLPGEMHIFRHVLESGQPQVIDLPKHHSLCQDCPSRSSCRETFEMCMPILAEGRAIGVIGLMCFTAQQREHILGSFPLFHQFLEQIAQFIALAAADDCERQQDRAVIALLEHVLDRLETGVMVLDERGEVSRLNATGRRVLALAQGRLLTGPVELTEAGEDLTGRTLYRMTWDGRNYTLQGRLYETGLPHYTRVLLYEEAALPGAGPPGAGSRRRMGAGRLLGRSRPVEELRQKIRRAANSPSPVLIRGEEGTEKLLVAQALHEESSRITEPFVAFGCASVPEELLEGELFGFAKGNSLGQKARPGRLEAADRGTLFLDEITRLSQPLQIRLLRALENRSFLRVGGDRPVRLSARLVFAAGPELEEALAQGRLRRDLFYKINIIPLELPPLRERRGDLRPMAQGFLKRYAAGLSREPNPVEDSFWQAVEGYSWPGNVWELQNVMESVSSLAPPRVPLTDQLLPEGMRALPAPPEEDCNLERLEAQAIRRALERCGGDKPKAARALGIGVATLYRKMKRYQLR